MIRIKAVSGLCNRLETLISYYLISKEKKQKLVVLWSIDPACNGYFLDYFEPIKDIEIVKNLKNYKMAFLRPETLNKWDSKNITKTLRQLIKPNSVIRNEIDSLQKKKSLHGLVGLHIRRTDLIAKMRKSKGFPKDFSYFQKIIQKYPSEQKFYLATDDDEAQKYFIKSYPDRIFYYAIIHANSNKRKTSLKHAIIDILALTKTKYFHGTPHSSFSNIVKRFRGEKIVILKKPKRPKPKVTARPREKIPLKNIGSNIRENALLKKKAKILRDKKIFFMSSFENLKNSEEEKSKYIRMNIKKPGQKRVIRHFHNLAKILKQSDEKMAELATKKV